MYQIDAICFVPFCGGYATLPQNYTTQTAQFIQALKIVMTFNILHKISLVTLLFIPVFVGATESFPEFSSPLFTFSIETSFNGKVRFEVSQDETTKQAVIYTERVLRDKRKYTNIKSLKEMDYVELIAKYRSANEIASGDKVGGFDGNTWCLVTEINRISKSRCFWEPEHDQENRKSRSILLLGRFLLKTTGTKLEK